MTLDHLAEYVPPTKFKIFTGILKAMRTEDGRPILRGTASSTIRDMHGDTMERTALEDMLQAANNNMTIFLNHSYNVPEDVAGSSRNGTLQQRGMDLWDLDLDVEVNTKNSRALEAFNAIEDGVKLGLSIGAMIPEGGAVRDKKSGAFTISHVELLETSIVGIPANPRSWISSAVKALNGAAKPESEVVHTITVENVVIPVDEIKAAVPAEPDVCGERNEDDSIACAAEPGHEGVHTWTAEVPPTETEDDSVVDGGSQELPSEPEPEPASEPDVDGAEPVDEVGPVVTSLTAALGMLESTASDLVTTRRLLAETEIARDAAIRERDEVLVLTNSVIAETSQIIEKLADTPVGRRAVARQAASEFSALERIYSPALLKLMRGNDA